LAQKPTYEQLELKIKKLKKIINTTQDAKRNYKKFLQFLPYPVLVRDAKESITYLNPAFTKTFGWNLDDLKEENKYLYIPDTLKNEINEQLRKLSVHKNILQFQTQRLTKEGKTLDVMLRIGIYRNENNNPGEMIIVLKDTTMELRNKRNRHAIIRISKALPQYPDLKNLLFYINTEIKDLLGTQGANVILLDKTQKKFYLVSAAHDDPATKERIEKIKFSIDELLSGQVVKTGKPIIVNNFSKTQHKYNSRNQKIGYEIKNVLLVPLKNKNRTIGILAADNKKTGAFDDTDLELLNTIATTVALSIENARVSRYLKKANEELHGQNIAKDKMINHLSHELKTPVAILLTSMKILSKRLADVDEKTWHPTMIRMERNLKRIIGIENEVYDIVTNKETFHNKFFSLILEQCQDEFEALIAEETGETDVIAKVRQKIENIFTTKDPIIKNIILNEFVEQRIKVITLAMEHRNIDLITHIKPTPAIRMPTEPLRKTIDGLIKNAVENSPDGSSIEIFVNQNNNDIQFIVKDHGIGLTKEAQKRIFEGFFSTQNTMDYSSKRAFDFNAGGKGADLLRMKIFSERYNFKIFMTSKQCLQIPHGEDRCPGTIGECKKKEASCDGGTTVTCLFPLDTD